MIYATCKRLNGDKSGFCYPKINRYCRVICKHFTEGFCKRAKYKVQFVEELEGSERSSRNDIDPLIHTIEKKETFRTKWLRRFYLYKLNKDIGGSDKTYNDNIVGRSFPFLPRTLFLRNQLYKTY